MNFLFSTGGRIGRWQWWLGHVINAALMGLAAVIISALNRGQLQPLVSPHSGLEWALTIGASVMIFWIGIASTVKRFHDRNKSGWWAAIMLVPGLGVIWTFYDCGLMAGSPGNNAYGPAPGQTTAETPSKAAPHEAALEPDIAARQKQSAASLKQAALANARYASDVRRILAAG